MASWDWFSYRVQSGKRGSDFWGTFNNRVISEEACHFAQVAIQGSLDH